MALFSSASIPKFLSSRLNKIIKSALLLALFGLCSTAYGVEQNNVYMIAENKINGTTYIQVVFFKSDEITTLAECDKEREYGLTSGWRIYTHLLKRKKGLSYSTYYSCVESGQTLSRWVGRRSSAGIVVYMVESKGSHMKVKLANSYSECVHEVRAIQEKETHQLFCGKSTQRVL